MTISPGYYQTVADAPDEVRVAFIRKVYLTLLGSLLVTLFSGWICTQPGVLETTLSLQFPIMIATFVVLIALSFARRTNGLNLALLALFSALEGALIGPLVAFYERQAPGIGMTASVLTLSIFGGLSAYALISRKDFSYLGGMLFVGLIAMIVAGLVLMFFHIAAMELVYCLAGVLLFCGFVLYDTSQIVHRLGPDDVVTGTISLYLDFINLFLFILRILGNRRN